MQTDQPYEPSRLDLDGMRKFLVREISVDRWQSAIFRIPEASQELPVSLLSETMQVIFEVVEESNHPHRKDVVSDMARDLCKLLANQFKTEKFLGRIATIGDLLQVTDDLKLMTMPTPAGDRVQ